MADSLRICGLIDILEAITRAIQVVQSGKHDPHEAHARISGMYDWSRIAVRTERVYYDIMNRPEMELWTRITRFVSHMVIPRAWHAPLIPFFSTMGLGVFAGPIFTIILVVNCYFLMFLEWWIPRADIEVVEDDWDSERFTKVRAPY